MCWQSFILKCGLWGMGRGLTSIWQFCFQNYNKFSCLTFPSHISSYLLTPWCSILNFEPPPCIYSGLQVLQLFCQPTSTTIHFPVIYCILLCYRPCPVDVSWRDFFCVMNVLLFRVVHSHYNGVLRGREDKCLCSKYQHLYNKNHGFHKNDTL